MCRGHCAVGPSCEWHVDSLSAATVYRRTPHRFCWGPTASAVIVTKAIKSERVNLWENMQGGDMIYTTQGEQCQHGVKRSVFYKLNRHKNITFHLLLSRGKTSCGN